METAADTFEAIPPEQSLATLGGVGILTLLALTSVAAAKRDKEYFEPKMFVFGDSLIADRAAIVAQSRGGAALDERVVRHRRRPKDV